MKFIIVRFKPFENNRLKLFIASDCLSTKLFPDEDMYIYFINIIYHNLYFFCSEVKVFVVLLIIMINCYYLLILTECCSEQKLLSVAAKYIPDATRDIKRQWFSEQSEHPNINNKNR